MREELVRQRTTLLSNGGGGMGLEGPVNMEKYVHDAQQLQRLEDQVVRLVHGQFTGFIVFKCFLWQINYISGGNYTAVSYWFGLFWD